MPTTGRSRCRQLAQPFAADEHPAGARCICRAAMRRAALSGWCITTRLPTAAPARAAAQLLQQARPASDNDAEAATTAANARLFPPQFDWQRHPTRPWRFTAT